ncbi:MAG: exodeoxyribonuclease VII large subunit [Rhizobiales bacterium]|nr:exodeoxyribonuclease VII large subunit [Hyphomicrobiales bacterium]
MAVDDSETLDNLPELSVSELSGAIKRTMEDAFGHVRLRGEISGFRGPHSSGHCYFALKDENARIDAVIWRGVYQRLKVKPEEGLEVIATGRVTTYPGRSVYQIVIERIEPAGVGALMALLEERRRKLAAEGLFDEAAKRPLPYLPMVIGVITSPTGAVIRDILHRLADRFPAHVLVWPVRVQGETSADEVAAAIKGFNALEPDGAIPRPELLIVARGGGSLEDLWSFNEEVVVRAAAASAIPLISAVGHETDWTLIDHAADRRAPTPTAAAEFAVPVRGELALALSDTGTRMARALRRMVAERRTRLDALSRAMPRRDGLLATQRQTIDRFGDGLRRWREFALARRREQVGSLAPRLSVGPLRRRLAQERARLIELDQRGVQSLRRSAGDRRRRLVQVWPRLARSEGRVLTEARLRLETLTKLAASLGHTSVLARGYALVRDGDQRLVRDVKGAVRARAIEIEFGDGRVAAEVAGESGPGPARKPSKPKVRPRGGGQGSLF